MQMVLVKSVIIAMIRDIGKHSVQLLKRKENRAGGKHAKPVYLHAPVPVVSEVFDSVELDT